MGKVATRVWESTTQTTGLLGSRKYSTGLNSATAKTVRQRGHTEEERTSRHGRISPAYSDASWGCSVWDGSWELENKGLGAHSSLWRQEQRSFVPIGVWTTQTLNEHIWVSFVPSSIQLLHYPVDAMTS